MTPRALVLPRGRRRPWLAVSALSLAILVCGWSVLWLVVRHEAERLIDGWIEVEAAQGRNWSCPDRSVSGFPLGLRIGCSHPSFAGRIGGVPLTATLDRLEARFAIYQPKAIDILAGGPLAVHRDGQNDVSANWAGVLVEARLLSTTSARAAIVADDLAVVGPDGRADRVRHAELRIAPSASRPAEARAYDVWLDLFDAIVPELDEHLGNGEPLSVDQKGVLTQVQDTAFAPWPQLLERWRDAGGVFDVETLKMTKGDLEVEARGQVGLDPEHRLAGRFSTTVSGYEALASRLGLPLQAVSAGGALAALLGHKADPSPAMIGAIPLPLRLADGRLSIGPFKTGLRFDPLY